MDGVQSKLLSTSLSKRDPERDACHSCCDDVNPHVLHDVARYLPDLAECAAVRGTHESKCVDPRVGMVDVDAAGVTVVADDEAGEEETSDDGGKVHEPDAVEDWCEHFCRCRCRCF